MTILIEPSDIVLSYNEKILNVVVNSIGDLSIKSYRLIRYQKIGVEYIKDKVYPLVSNNANNEIVFNIDRNGYYVVRLYYSINGSDMPCVESEYFFIQDSVPSYDVLKSLIKLEQYNNKIILDISQVIKYIYSFYEAIFSLNGYSVCFKRKLVHYVYMVNTKGILNVNLKFIDLDMIQHEFIFNLDVEKKELSTKNIVKNTISAANQYKFLLHIIYAFILREFQRKYDKGYLRYFSIILGPAVQLIILVTIFTIMGRKSVAGLGIPLFVLTGILPYTFFTSAGNCLTIVSGNRSLLSYRQVKIIDIILSSILMELLVNLVVFFGGIFVCWYFGISIKIYNPLSLILAFLLLFIFTLGLSMILAVIGFYFAEFNYAIQVVFRALFYISGVFFSIENVPVQYQKYVLWNPLLQLIEFIRLSFVSFNLPHELSYIYLFKCTLAIFLLGIAMYFVNRNKFMVNDRAR